MVKRITLLAALLWASTLSLLATNPPTSPLSQTPTDAHIFGHVVDADTGEKQVRTGEELQNGLVLTLEKKRTSLMIRMKRN